jgi:hypothetical protein
MQALTDQLARMGIPGDQRHFQLGTIGDLSEDHIRGAEAARARVFER